MPSTRARHKSKESVKAAVNQNEHVVNVEHSSHKLSLAFYFVKFIFFHPEANFIEWGVWGSAFR